MTEVRIGPSLVKDVAAFPDPTDVGGTYHFPIGIHFEAGAGAVSGPHHDVDPINPIVQHAQKRCAKRVGVPGWGDGPGTSRGSIVDIVGGADG